MDWIALIKYFALSSLLSVPYEAINNYNLQKNTGYSSVRIPQEAVKVGNGLVSATNNWAWIMLGFKPTLLKTKKEEIN